MNHLLREMMRTIREARNAVCAELEVMAQTETVDPAVLSRIGEAALSFADQADGFSLTMKEREGTDDLRGEAQELAAFFRAAGDQIAASLGPGRG